MTLETMHAKPLHVSLSGRDLPQLLAAVHASGLFARGAPSVLNVDDQSRPPSADWIERWVPHCRREVFAAWDEGYQVFLAYTKDMVVKASAPSVRYDGSTIVDWLDALPFELASFGAIHPAWSSRPDFPGPGFGDLHFPLGWACAFKGAGHARLVSRRWLDHGPWLLARGPNDTSFVQFHETDADSDTAFAQAMPGHLRMGIDDKGGFIQSDYVYTHKIAGIYIAAERRLAIPVHGRTVSQAEMLDACATRLYQALGAGQRIDSIGYVFADEENARSHLHELWLRELECRTMASGRETRLDATYRPPVVKPDWVVRLQARHPG
ncbi:MAG: hypothetical protein ACM3SO_06390 [Betaproteobacteria bacterium]